MESKWSKVINLQQRIESRKASCWISVDLPLKDGSLESIFIEPKQIVEQLPSIGIRRLFDHTIIDLGNILHDVIDLLIA